MKLNRSEIKLIGVLLLAALTFTIRLAWAQQTIAQELLRTQIESVRQLPSGAARIASTQVLADLYEQRDFQRVWLDVDKIKALLQAIKDSENDGLNPEDYHFTPLKRFNEQLQNHARLNAQTLIHFDLLLTDALIRLSYHLMFGKVDPVQLDSHWNLSREIDHLDPVLALRAILHSDNLYQAIQRLKPQHDFYTHLTGALADYRTIQKAGGWQSVPPGETLKPGMTDARIPFLRRRLVASGDLEQANQVASPLFDKNLEAAVKRFQFRHRLDVDGVVGRHTLAALNIPVVKRIHQLRVNLERARWVMHDLPDTFIVVNIAGFEVYLVRDGKPVWQTRAVVGSHYRKTPVFKADMKYLVFNPTWTIPRSIVVEEMLPKVKGNPNYLRAQYIDVIDSAGHVIDQDRIDWSRYTGRTFPYLLRQSQGAYNALGKVKFIFPNPYAVYIHDTPSKRLFRRATRTFSHGCIRIEHPLQFAALVLHDPRRWNAKTIQQVVARGKTRTVFLPEPIPVLLLYWTAEVGRDGKVFFMEDVYDRDQVVLTELDKPFESKLGLQKNLEEINKNRPSTLDMYRDKIFSH
jgi:murein L,D-transpeptidase YcbB/YkuD